MSEIRAIATGDTLQTVLNMDKDEAGRYQDQAPHLQTLRVRGEYGSASASDIGPAAVSTGIAQKLCKPTAPENCGLTWDDVTDAVQPDEASERSDDARNNPEIVCALGWTCTNCDPMHSAAFRQRAAEAVAYSVRGDLPEANTAKAPARPPLTREAIIEAKRRAALQERQADDRRFKQPLPFATKPTATKPRRIPSRPPLDVERRNNKGGRSLR